MPSIAESLRKAGYLKPVQDAFKDIYGSIQQDKEQEAFNNTLGDAFKQMQDTIRPTGENIPSQQSGPGSTRLSEFMPNKDIPEVSEQNQTNPQPVKSLNDLANVRTSEPVKKYADMSPVEKQKYHQGILADTMMKSEQFKHLDPAMKDRMLKALQLKAQSIESPQPTSELKQFKKDEDTDIVTTNADGTISLKNVSRGTLKPHYSAPNKIKAEQDYPERGIKKGDLISVMLDENDPSAEPKIIGKADTTSSDIAKQRLEVSKGEFGLRIKEFNQKLKEKDPAAILQSGNDVLAAIDEQLKTTNKFQDEIGYNALINAKTKAIALISRAKAQLQSGGGTTQNGQTGKPKISY